MTERTITTTAAAPGSARDEAWRVTAGAAAAILVSTAAVGTVIVLGAGDHIPLALRLENLTGASFMMTLVLVPGCLFGIWPADSATRRMPRAARLGLFALAGALVGAATGTAFSSLWGSLLDGALVGAGVGILAALAGLLGLDGLSRSRGLTATLAVVTVVVVALGVLRVQDY